MRFLLAFTLLLPTLQYPTPRPAKISQPKQQQASTQEQTTTAEQRGTEQSPLVVKTIPPVKSKEETDRDDADREEKSANDRHIVWLTGALALVAFGQLCVYWYQATKLKETVEASTEQGKAMERHIGEAARSANAMEAIAKTIEDGNQIIMRAYVTTVIGGAIYQERREGQSDLKFEGKVTVLNTGNTPARKVSIRKKADILPISSWKDFAFPLPEGDNEPTYASIGAHQNYVIESVVKDVFPYEDVPSIKEGRERGLCMWGEITYDDIFGKTHHTKFAHWLYWHPDRKVFGYYIPGQNEAD